MRKKFLQISMHTGIGSHTNRKRKLLTLFQRNRLSILHLSSSCPMFIMWWYERRSSESLIFSVFHATVPRTSRAIICINLMNTLLVHSNHNVSYGGNICVYSVAAHHLFFSEMCKQRCKIYLLSTEESHILRATILNFLLFFLFFALLL